MPSGLNATLITASVWPVSGWPMGWPVSASHTRTVLSLLPEAMRCAVGAERHAAHRLGVAGEWLADGLAGVGVPHPHRVVPLPETMRVPSGLNATLITGPVWPVSGAPMGWPVAASHSRTVLSALPEAMRCPSGLNATLDTVVLAVDDLDEVDHLGQHVEQGTVIGRLRESSRRNQLLVRAHFASGAGTGQHRLGLGDQPQAGRLAETRVGLLPLR